MKQCERKHCQDEGQIAKLRSPSSCHRSRTARAPPPPPAPRREAASKRPKARIGVLVTPPPMPKPGREPETIVVAQFSDTDTNGVGDPRSKGTGHGNVGD